MNQPTVRTPAPKQVPTETLDLRLSGSWLVAVRTGWVVFVLLILSLFIASLPLYFASVQLICTGACTNGQLTLDNVRALQALGISLKVYAIFNLVLAIALALVWFIVGGIIFWRKSDNRMALLAAFTLFVFGTSNVVETLAGIPSAWQTLASGFNDLAFLLLLCFFSLFPSGRFAPRWMRWVLLGFVVVSACFTLFPQLAQIVGFLGSGLYLGFIGSIVVAQIYRYRRVSSLVERQQTKWVVFGVAVAIVLIIVSYLLYDLFPSLRDPQQLYGLAVSDLEVCAYVLIPLSIGLALLRYRLWDVDALINKALVYGGLSGLLVALYTALVIGLEYLLRLLSGQTNQPIVIVLSTLVIAGLFQPLRARIQAIIDRRFYRSKYDAAKTLEAFSATLRNEVDLSQLRKHLVTVVQDTMQPAHVSLWLRPLEHDGTHQAPWRANSPVDSQEN